MVRAGHVTAAGGRVQSSSVWSISLRLDRPIWWLPLASSLSTSSTELRTCGTAGRRSLLDPRSQVNGSSSRGRRNRQNGRSRISGNTAFHCRSSFFATATANKEDDQSVPSRDVVRSAGNLLVEPSIRLAEYRPGEYRALCPVCDGGSTRKRSLAVKITNTGFSLCHRGNCGWKRAVKSHPSHWNGEQLISSRSARPSVSASQVRPLTIQGLKISPNLADEVIEWFRQRGITRETLEKYQVMQLTINGKPKSQVTQRTVTEKDKKQVVIAFPYMRDGEIVNCKFRSLDKKFWQVKGAEKVLYGLDDIKDKRVIIIVEGEIDKLTLCEAGFTNCVSVPDGAPSKLSVDGPVPPPIQDKKYKYLHNCRDYFKQARRIVLATDADEPGQALAEEIARRLGRDRCWRVKWPTHEGGTVCKDANEVLQRLGPEAVREVIETSELYPT